ncbi:hypothetical protein [Streptomyces sp. MJP52]|uniref:hypothetical protein n=1 Tax=Streptomyces sp. MJP52 TaxID=2940555 RepID=UPI00247358AA|nr:hypothetical protein [Streptomyces sp. MJP52]MDH6228872.1 hypothetical protein [Streptomyces sp. MJP52]
MSEPLLHRLRAERDDLRGQAQLLARIVHVLEIGNSKLKEINADLEQQVADRASVPDLTRRRRQLRPLCTTFEQRIRML